MSILLWVLGTREIKMAYLMSDQFGYDSAGYRLHEQHRDVYPDEWRAASGADGGVEVLPADYWDQQAHSHRTAAQAGRPFFSARHRRSPSGFVIRHYNGRWYIETTR